MPSWSYARRLVTTVTRRELEEAELTGLDRAQPGTVAENLQLDCDAGSSASITPVVRAEALALIL